MVMETGRQSGQGDKEMVWSGRQGDGLTSNAGMVWSRDSVAVGCRTNTHRLVVRGKFRGTVSHKPITFSRARQSAHKERRPDILKEQ